MKRRDFLSALAPTVLMPPGAVTPLRSPKDEEHVKSLQKVSVQAVVPAYTRPAVIGGVSGLAISVMSGQVTISWQSGTPPFRVEQAVDIHGPWVEVGPYTLGRSVTVPATTPYAFFRVHEQVPMPLSATAQNNKVSLFLTPPQNA